MTAIIVVPNPQSPFGEGLSHLQADAFFLLLALRGVLGLAFLWTALGREAVNCSSVLRPGVIFSILSGLMTTVQGAGKEVRWAR